MEFSQRMAISSLKTRLNELDSTINRIRKLSAEMMSSRNDMERNYGSAFSVSAEIIEKDFVPFKEVFEKTIKEWEEAK